MAKWQALADTEIGKRYTIQFCQSETFFKTTVESRDKTHTYLKHTHGVTALPTNISIDLVKLKPHE